MSALTQPMLTVARAQAEVQVMYSRTDDWPRATIPISLEGRTMPSANTGVTKHRDTALAEDHRA